uniref:Uncharacterized protein n=1 Tax=Setaria italica TaxID=4555 RepID=K4AN58_SETIT
MIPCFRGNFQLKLFFFIHFQTSCVGGLREDFLAISLQG